jgi:NAD(P)-dependent dehydrogenase (short-subunit alcohol dehydrogenase family)
MKDFAGKTAFVTGGASGIGLGMARAFGRAGMNVVLADIDKAAAVRAAEELAREQIKAAPVFVDVADGAAVRAAALEALAAFGKVHVVCNNAGVAGASGILGQASERDWDWIIDVNLKGVVHGVETFVPLIRSHGEGGHIVNTASLAGILSGPGAEPYSATKFAVVAMSEGWVRQLEPMGIGLSVLCPGYVRTQIAHSRRARQERYGPGARTPDFGASGPIVDAIAAGLDPDIVGARVLEAIRDDDLYIFTDPRFRELVDRRFAAIQKGFDAAAASPALGSVKSWAAIPGLTAQDG